MFVSHRTFVSLFVVLIATSCSNGGRSLDGSLGVVEVIETPPPIALQPEPLPVAEPLPPVFIYGEPLPLPARHTVHVRFEPANVRTLDEVQSVEIDVEVEGGAYGERTINAVFVSPAGFAWEKQLTLIDAKPGVMQHAHFTLPVAATFIADQKLAGAWQVTTLDDGVEQASATFALEE
jgi:hypothetical protein